MVRRALALVALLVLVPAPAHAESDSWHGKVCSTYADPAPPGSHKLCTLINQSDIQPSLKQGLVRLNDGLLSGATDVWVDYVYLYRDGDVVDTASNTDTWLDVCDTCTPNYVSTTWDGTTGSHTWRAVARFRLRWPGGQVTGYFTLWSGLWQP